MASAALASPAQHGAQRTLAPADAAWAAVLPCAAVALRAAGARSVYVSYQSTFAEELDALQAAGFVPAESRTEAGGIEYLRLVDGGA